MSRLPRIQLLAWCGVSGLGSALALLLASGLGQPVSVSFGHGDREYTSGFRRGQGPEYLVTERWGRQEASFWLPVRIVGPGRLRLEGSRPGMPETEMRIRQDGLVGRFVAGPSRQSHEFEIVAGSTPSYDLIAASGESDRSILVSRISIDPERPFSLQPEPAILLRTALGAALLAAALSSSLGAARAALASGVLFGLSLSLVAAFDLFAALHLARKVPLIVPFLVAAAGLVWRRRDYALLIVAAGVMLRCGLVFQPYYGSQDVEVHRAVAAIAHDQGAGELWGNLDRYQRQYSLGTAHVEGSLRPFPYPPTLHTVAGLWPRRDLVDAMKAISIAAQAAIILLAMAIARTLKAPATGVTLTGLLACVSPAEIRELLMASYPAVLGHALDTAVVVVLLRYWDGLRSPWGVALASLGIATSALTYNAGVVHFGLFLPLLLLAASLRPSQPGRVWLASSAVLGGLLALSYYGSYFSDMLANLGKSYAGEGRFDSMAVRTELAFGDWRDVGWPLAAVAILGLRHVVRDQWNRPESRVVAAWAAYCLVISIPVLLLPEPLAYVRRLYFAFPLMFALTGCFLGRRDRLAAAVGLALLAWSFAKISTFIVPYYITYSGSLAPA